MNFGVVVVGYQGIGKSSLSRTDLRFIDLESGNFWIDDKRDSNWYKYYCNIAVDLASQGYIVFTSSHKEVRDYLKKIKIPENVNMMCVVPSLELKDLWIDKLWNRWRLSQLTKDFKAYANAAERYTENIQEIKDDIKIVCELKSMNYNLKDEVLQTLKIYGKDVGIFELGSRVE